MSKILLLIIALCYTAFAQITINSSDIANQYSVGKSTTVHELDSMLTINIGSQGGGNNWDFTSLLDGVSSFTTSVDPSTTPHISEFPGADIAFYSTGMFNGEQAEFWQYSQLDGSFDYMGGAVTLVSQPGDLFTIKDVPPSQDAVFPLTYNSHWMQTFTETSTYNGTPISSTTYSIDVTVDAYGTMTLPGGHSFNALRSRYVESDGSNTKVDYNFFSVEGAIVSFYASDSNPPVSGVIDIEGYNWNLETTTDVERIENIPDDYSLSQNFPNPFNPSTNINFSIPQTTFVSLEVFNTLGEKIDVLVSKELRAGSYNFDWNAEGIESGVYFYKLQAGNFVETKKMILLR